MDLVKHIHDEALYLTYENNGTVKDSTTAVGATWVGPSLTPLTNLNSGEQDYPQVCVVARADAHPHQGFRMYEVDEKTFECVLKF